LKVLRLNAIIDLVDGAVISSHLTVNAKIKGISDDAFQQQVTKAEKSPISKITDCTISTSATLL
jgi:osmotically inducible protein OsmC